VLRHSGSRRFHFDHHLMQRRRFLQTLGVIGSTPLLGACARTFGFPIAAMATPDGGPGAERDAEGVWREGAAYARWAPSPHNIQPWRLRVVSAMECELLYDPARLLPTTDPTSAFTIMGLAMFVEYLSIAVGSRGFAVHAEYADTPLDYTATRPTHFARLTLLPSPNTETFERRLLLERQTSRLPYDGSAIDVGTMDALARLSREYQQTMSWSSDDELVRWTLDLNRFTLFRDLDDDAGRTELRRWIRTTDDEAAEKKDGLWSHCLRFPGWLLKAFFDEHEKWGRGWRARMCGSMLVRGMSGTRTVAWWSGPFAGPTDWINAGAMLGRAWLHLTARGIQMHPFGSIITNTEAHAKLTAKVGAPPGRDQLWLLVRLGRSAVPPRSYRLDEHSIFLDDDSHR
jgi:hypothetical protein